jgi:hypothetical protein
LNDKEVVAGNITDDRDSGTQGVVSATDIEGIPSALLRIQLVVWFERREEGSTAKK